MNMFRPVVSAALSPNTEPDDIRNAWKTMLMPQTWTNGEALGTIRSWFAKRYGVTNVWTFDSGRSALYVLLQSMGIGAGDEVICQAFTCVAVPNSIRWTGAMAVFADIDKTLNIDPKNIERRITPRTKALIVQHTFGIPADMDALTKLAKKHALILIEDCAHGLGATYKGRPVGSFGDAAFFSFGRDKPFSSVWGGAAIVRNGTETIRRMDHAYRTVPMPARTWIARELFHPVAFSWILPLYPSGIGKLILVVFQKLGLLSLPVFPEEKRGEKPDMLPMRYPNALAALLVLQLSKLDRYVAARKQDAAVYRKRFASSRTIELVPDRMGASYLRFPVLVRDPHAVWEVARNNGILLGRWYRNVIDPVGTDVERVGYRTGSCPRAESIASRIINLPTRIPESALWEIVRLCDAVQ